MPDAWQSTRTHGEDKMKVTFVSRFAALIICLMGLGPGHAQSASPSTPTTRILAIGTVNPGVDLTAVRAILPIEVRETVKLYLDGKIDQWYSLQERAGVVFILNVTDPADAHAMLEKLPLGQAHLMSFELMPLGPLGPLRQLPGMTTSSAASRTLIKPD
jgi:hypothetical protein